MKTRRFLFFFLMLAICAVSLFSHESIASSNAKTVVRWPDLTAAIDELYVDYDKPYHPGGVTAVLYKGEVLHLKAYGAANREFNVPWTPDTRYRIASWTKSIVANAMMILEDRRLLSLQDPVRKHLPDFPDYGVPLTLKHLLQMSSGLWLDEILVFLTGAGGTDTLDAMYALTSNDR